MLTREQLKKVLGGLAMGSGGGSDCSTDADCSYLGPNAECIAGVCEQVSGSSGACTSETPFIYQCQPSWYGCCPDPMKHCEYTPIAGYQCQY